MLQLVHLAGFARERALKLRSSDPRSADDHQALFGRLQLAAAACVRNDESGEARDKEEDVQKLFLSDDGRKALEHAVQIEAKELLAQPVVQGYMKVAWRENLVNLGWEWVLALLVLLLQLLFVLPLVALVPPLYRLLKDLSEDTNMFSFSAACRSRVTTSCTFPSSSLASSAPPTWPSPSRSRSSRPSTSPPRPLRRCCSSGWEAGSCGRPAKSWRLAATQSRGGVACTAVSLPTGATASTASTPRRSSFRLQRSSRSCQPATARTRQPRLCARWPSSYSGFASSACCSSRQRFGPYVLMFFRMLFGDVLYFMVLLFVLLVAFAASWTVLLGPPSPSPQWRDDWPSHARPEPPGAPTSLAASTLTRRCYALFEGALTGNDFFECARDSTNSPVGGMGDLRRVRGAHGSAAPQHAHRHVRRRATHRKSKGSCLTS